ncbi:MAG: hypothetical protein MUO40_00630 [Anaerolineaceae bacterium]|nr:hypothetical protein [Anaerolineaceae bacterium]
MNQPLASFHNDTHDGKRIFFFLLGLCFLLITFSILYYGISYTITAVNQFDPVAIFNSIKYYALAALCACMFFLLFSIKAFPPKPVRLDVTPDHLVLIKGRRTSQIRWSEIESIRFKITRFLIIKKESKRTFKVWIKSSQLNRNVVIKDLVGAESAMTVIRERAFPFIQAGLFSTFKEGSPINFGIITAQQGSGVTIRNRHFPWHEIRSLHIKNGRVLIWNIKGKIIFNYTINKIPNLDTLLSLFQDQGIDLLTL